MGCDDGWPRNAAVLIPLVCFSEVRKGDKGVYDCSEAKKDLGKLMGIWFGVYLVARGIVSGLDKL
jgi:hypothetical protein